MDSSRKVIDFLSRKNNAKSKTESSGSDAPVLDLVERREAILSQERRKVKRTILSEFVGAYVVLPKLGLQKCLIYDISDNGIAVDLEIDSGRFNEGENIAVRVYLNQKTYFPFTVQVQNVRTIDDEAVHRHGCSFVKGAVNEEALFHFVRFIETVSASLATDKGDIVVSDLRKTT